MRLYYLRYLLPMLALTLSCKTVKPDNDAVIEQAEIGDENLALDVNDVSIFFDKTGPGAFYPNIPVRNVWQDEAFESMIKFAKGESMESETKGVRFGQFFLPKEYTTLVEAYRSDPKKAIPAEGDRVRIALHKATKEIANEILAGGTVCESFGSDGTWRCHDKKAFPNFLNHRAGIAKKANWRIVSMRMDLCAEARPGAADHQCEVEFRLIAQPFGDFAPVAPPKPQPVRSGQGPFMFDVSAHLIYKIGSLDLKTGEVKDFNGNVVTTARKIISDLQMIKKASPENTNGKPLGVHPGLKMEARMGGEALATAISEVVRKYTKNGSALTNVTTMQVAGPALFDSSVWVFFQGYIQSGVWYPAPITGSSNLVFSIRTASVQGAGGKMYPPPENISVNPLFSYEKGESLPTEVRALPAFIDNPGKYGDPELKVGSVPAASVRNTDCISCHMTATRSFEWGIKSLDAITRVPQPNMYSPPVGTTAYLDPDVVPRIDYNLRNFGYFLPAPLNNPLPPSMPEPGLGIFNFPGPRTEKAAIMTRVVNESAELVNLINSRFLKLPNPGLVCQGEDPNKALEIGTMPEFLSQDAQQKIRRSADTHAAISDCILFQSYRPGMSFDSCIKQCGMSKGNPPRR